MHTLSINNSTSSTSELKNEFIILYIHSLIKVYKSTFNNLTKFSILFWANSLTII